MTADIFGLGMYLDTWSGPKYLSFNILCPIVWGGDLVCLSLLHNDSDEFKNMELSEKIIFVKNKSRPEISISL
jgi:hypothetical protein